MKLDDIKDLNTDFSINPLSGDVSIKKGLDAVKQSLKNLIMMKRFDKPFDPNLDVGLDELLFENLPSDVFSVLINDKINYIIGRYEPRITVKKIEVQDLSDQNMVQIDILFTLKNQTNEQVQNLQVFFERVR